MKSSFFLVLIFCCSIAAAQNLTGIVISDSVPKPNVNIKNLSNDHTAVSDANGTFTIKAAAGDIVVLSAIDLETRRKTLSASDFDKPLQIKMAQKTTALHEVTIDNSISAESLGIIPEGQKKYTPAESRLYTARTGLLDPLLNKISGRTAMLKKEVIAEHNMFLLDRMDGWFDEKFYRETLQMPAEYIGGFRYYAILDPDFSRALNDRNKTLGGFLIRRLALSYLQSIGETAAPEHK